MTGELYALTLTIEIEPSALALLQQQADQQGLTLDQLAARYIGRSVAHAETHAGHIRAANAFNGLVEPNQPKPQQGAPAPGRKGLRALAREAGGSDRSEREATTSRDVLPEGHQASMPTPMQGRGNYLGTERISCAINRISAHYFVCASRPGCSGPERAGLPLFRWPAQS